MALLAYFDRLKAQGGTPMPSRTWWMPRNMDRWAWTRCQGLPSRWHFDADFQKMKDQMTGIFNAAIGIGTYPRITTVREKLYAPRR